MPRPLRAVTFALVAALAIITAACGQGAGGTNLPARTGALATAGSGGATAPTTGGGSAKAACDLLSDDEIKRITDLTVVSENSAPADTVYANVCRWTLSSGEMDLGVLNVGAKDRFDRTIELEGGTEVPGLGDRAARTELTGSLFVLRGDTMLDLFTLGTGTSDEVEVELMQAALANLGG